MAIKKEIIEVKRASLDGVEIGTITVDVLVDDTTGYRTKPVYTFLADTGFYTFSTSENAVISRYKKMLKDRANRADK